MKQVETHQQIDHVFVCSIVQNAHDSKRSKIQLSQFILNVLRVYVQIENIYDHKLRNASLEITGSIYCSVPILDLRNRLRTGQINAT